MARLKQLLVLFGELFRISLCVLGGGYAILMVSEDVFSRKGWIKEGELVDHLPIFQMIPGIIASHTAVYVGSKREGALGAAVGVLAVALPSVIVFTAVSLLYQQLPLSSPWLASAFVGLRASLTGVIAATLIKTWTRSLSSPFAYGVMALTLSALALGGWPIVLVLPLAMLAGVVQAYTPKRKKGITVQSSPLALLVFLKYGLLAIGGGFVTIPMYMEDFVGASAHWLQISQQEFGNIIALTQMTPGPVGVNCATFFGFRLAGIPGALIASVFLLVPGAILMFFVLKSLDRFKASRLVSGILDGARPASISLILLTVGALATHDYKNPIYLLLSLITIPIVMKKKLSILMTILLSTVLAGLLHAEEAADAVTTARFPDADTVTLNELQRVTYQPDGSYVVTNEVWTKILTEKGRREESVVSLDFNRRYGDGHILSVGRIGPDGVEHPIDISATMKETTDNSSMSANIYDPLDRKVVATLPGLKVGDTLHVLTTQRETKARCQNEWADLTIFQWTHPILRSTYEVLAPASLPIVNSAIRHSISNVTSTVKTLPDGSMLHIYVATNSPQVFPEPSMPPLYTQVEHIRVSTAKDWPTISRWYWNLCAPHLEKTNGAMSNKVEEIGHDIRALFKFVSQEVRYMGLTMEDTSPGYAPHDVNITFDNRYGVCRDKAGLLVAMLRLAGFNAFPVLIHVGAKLDQQVPQPYFNHAIVCVDQGNRDYMLMDPTNESTKDLFPGYLADRSYLVCRPEGEDLRTSPVPTTKENGLEVTSTGTLSKDGSLVVETSLDFNGINDSSYRGAFVRLTPEKRVKFFDRIVKAIAPGAELLTSEVLPKDLRDTDAPLKMKITARYPEMLLKGETRSELSVPFLGAGLGVANWLLSDNTALVERKFPLRLYTTAGVHETVKLDLSANVGPVVELPPEEKTSGKFAFDLSYSVTNGTLVAKRMLDVSSLDFSTTEYGDLREQIKSMEAGERKNPVFANDPLEEADVHVLLDKSETTVLSDRAWVTTNTVVKEILTYEGKKGASEMKFNFNPACGSVEVLSAVVSNKDGRVSCVTPKEMNVMDCGWAASAPRYPASKMLIVNLPSVEIGSVISYTVVHNTTNAPAPYYASFIFDSHEPLDRRVVRVNDWTREVVHPRRLPNEPFQPNARFWRDYVLISSNHFAKIDLQVKPFAYPEAGKDLKSIRDWMSRYVKLQGPGLYEVPLAEQLTSPEQVLKERYGTRLDYIRTLCSLLKAAGYDAEVVLSSSDANDCDAVKEEIKFGKPNVRAFGIALCRVNNLYFIGTENEYTPIGATAYDGCDYFDPQTATFGVVRAASPALQDYTLSKREILVREDGSVDIAFDNFISGPSVGGFRKTFTEMLPEDRSRFYQGLLGDVAEAAVSTRELETDVTGYPARRSFSCYVPDYAVKAKDCLTIDIPGLITPIPTLTGTIRQTPVSLGADDPQEVRVTVRFPKGYTVLEHAPESFTFTEPNNPQKVWLVSTVASEVKDGILSVELVRKIEKTQNEVFPASVYELLKEERRRTTSRANTTLSVRKAE